MTTKDGKDKITINKRTLILSLVVLVSLSVFLVVSGPLSSSLLLSPIRAGAQQQPTSQPSSQPSSRPQQPSSSSSSSSSTTTLSPSTSGGSAVSPQAKGGGGGGNSGKQCDPNKGPATVCKGGGKPYCVYPSASNSCNATCSNPNGINCLAPPNAIAVCTPGGSDADACTFHCFDGYKECGILGSGGQCVPEDAPKQTCLGVCTDLGTKSNCSTCFDDCSTYGVQGIECLKIPGSMTQNFACQCPSGQSNSNGKCCPTGTTNCNGQCVDTNTNDFACGSSCTDCVMDGKTCVSGSCQCPTGKVECNGKCVDPSSNTNCGAGTSSICGADCTKAPYPSGSSCALVGGTTYMCKDQLNCIGNSCNGNANECGIPSGCVSCDRCVNIQPFP